MVLSRESSPPRMVEINISRAKSIKGFMSTKELEWLAKTAQTCRIIVEFGSYLGRSTRALADNCINGKVYAVDPWCGEYFKADDSPIALFHKSNYQDFVENMRDHIESGKVLVFMDYSHKFPYLPNWADLTFIDGDHRYPCVIEDISHALVMTKKLGIISGHDYNHPEWPGVKQAVDEVFDEVNLIDSIWWATK